MKAVSASVLTRADVEGDGADECSSEMATGSAPSGRDLEDRWCWPTRDPVREVIPARAGQPAVVVLDSMVGLDGATGRPRWDGHGATAVLDPGDPATAASARRIGRRHGLPAGPGHDASGGIPSRRRRAGRTSICQ